MVCFDGGSLRSWARVRSVLSSFSYLLRNVAKLGGFNVVVGGRVGCGMVGGL